MYYPKDLQDTATITGKYADLAVEEYKMGNIRHANTLYRRGRKYLSKEQKDSIPATLSKLVQLLGIEAPEPHPKHIADTQLIT